MMGMRSFSSGAQASAANLRPPIFRDGARVGEANLLSVLTREETRIENELVALDVCIEFLMTVEGATEANKDAANSLSDRRNRRVSRCDL
jgi:hypothetical protein